MSQPGKPGRQVLQAPRFARPKRRFPRSAQLAVDDGVKGLLTDPLAGEPKVGALKGVRVVKFKVGAQQLLLAYQFDTVGRDTGGRTRARLRVLQSITMLVSSPSSISCTLP